MRRRRLTAAQLEGGAQQRHERGEHQALVERQVSPEQLLAQDRGRGRGRRLRGRCGLRLLPRGAPGACGSKCGLNSALLCPAVRPWAEELSPAGLAASLGCREYSRR